MLNRFLFLKKQRSLFVSRLIGGGIWALGAKVATLILGIIIGGLLARLLSKDEMGDYVFAQSLVFSISLIAQLGLGSTAVKLVARFSTINDHDAVKKSIIHVLRLGLISALIIATFFIVFGKYANISQNLLYIGAIWIIILTIQKLLAEILRGFHDIRAAAFIGGASLGGLITYIITAGILAIVWHFFGNINLFNVFTLIIVSGVLSLIWGGQYLFKILRSNKSKITQSRKVFAKQVLWMSLPVLVDSLMLLLLSQSGIWVLRVFRTSPEVALYGTALRLAALTAVPLNVIHAITAPTIAELFQKEQEKKLEFILRGLATLATIPAVSTLLIFFVAGADILGLIYGDFYRAGAPALIIMTVGSVASVAAGSCGQSLIMSGHQKSLMIASMVSGLLTLTIELIVVQRYGILGVATAMAIGILFKNGLMLIANKYQTGIWTLVTFRWQNYIPLIKKL